MGKTLTFVGLFFANTLAASVYSVVGPYLPNEAKNKGISSTFVGLILVGYPIPAFISSITIGKSISLLGKKRVLLLGCFFEGISTLAYSFLPYSSFNSFLIIGFTFRLFQGLGAGLMNTTMLTIIASDHRNELQKYLGLLQVSTAIGFMVGPLGASVLFSLGGFFMIFFTYGVIFLGMLPFLYRVVSPDNLNENKSIKLSPYTIDRNHSYRLRNFFVYTGRDSWNDRKGSKRVFWLPSRLNLWSCIRNF